MIENFTESFWRGFRPDPRSRLSFSNRRYSVKRTPGYPTTISKVKNISVDELTFEQTQRM